ncbi:hypothetical protein 2 [Beihai picorna-like virus 5]|uniref:hypothetical protein 2 n=1 Tax=Beihai picorna-like virus 5 TaxID=1922594 RepID=UPI0009094740|nr:hypothetical protein 2 [Beihai picorna-like virus 5]APG76846.1 hypothetical protein 2 [Beihai picorna-like virus 5]
MDPTRDYGYYGDADLAEFLRRPVRILDADWTVTTGSFQQAIDPWTLFLENTQVRNRVEGYRTLQGTLNLRIAINGGPFLYGRMIAAYFPLQSYNDHSFGATTGEYYKQQLSMLPHVFLDPTTSEGGEIVCPFLCPDNWIDLSGGFYSKMGRLHLCSVNDLLHANSATGKVNISVYAWMTNVRLAGPTTAPYETYEAHSGEELAYGAASISVLGAVAAWMRHFKCSFVGEDRSNNGLTLPDGSADMQPHAGDEYGSGIVSKPASAIAKVAGTLANIPIIRPFARPTEMVAEGVGRMAHIFGYSRPTVVSDLNRAKIKNAGNMANTDQHEAVVKLSLDSKQELSIDPRTVGLSDVDEMAFNYLKQKECYMSTMEWTESQVNGDNIGTMSVGPDFHNEETINGHPLNLLAPMYTVAAPFKFWRGSIKLRFQIVASQLHRGRLRFSYDPYRHQFGERAEENETYSRIVDLATHRDFEMVIAWNHPQSWLRVYDRLGSSLYNHPIGTTTITEDYHNGQVRVEVVNELTSPNPALAQPVYINLFVSAGEDFEVAGPTDDMLNKLEYEPQSGYEPHSGVEGEEIIVESDNIPESPAPITPVGQQERPDNPTTHVFFGESFASVRALLKRYCYHQSYATASGLHSYIVESNFPTEPGVSKAPRHVTDVTATPSASPYSYTAMTHLNWFVPCYVGWRGGLRSKYVKSNGGTIFVRRFSEPVHQADCGLTTYTISTGDASRGAYNALGLYASTAGCDMIYTKTDGCSEVEFPFYSHRRFAPGRRFLDGTGLSGNEWLGENGGHLVALENDATSTTYLNRFVAAGDDFSCFMFIGQPGVLRRSEKPLANGGQPLPPY